MKRDHDGHPPADPATDAAVGFSRAEMHAEPVAGKASPPEVHLFVVWGKASEWAKKLEEESGSPLQRVGAALEGASKSSTRVSAVEAAPGGDDEQGDVLVFPHMVRLRRAAADEDGCRRVAERVKAKDWSGAEPLPFRVAAMVCSHASRDARCGYCGPALFALIRAKSAASVLGSRTYMCSHVGGHQYAGNVLLFRSTSTAPGSDKSSVCDWLSYVSPADVDAVVKMMSAPPSDAGAFPPHELHARWRGRQGMDEAKHAEVAGSVMAACEGCCASTRDVEDGVSGYPSPAHADANAAERKRFRSPSGAGPGANANGPNGPKSPAARALTGGGQPALDPIDPKPRVLFVLGPPGAGKGTVCANLVRDFGVVHLSAGDLLRDERAAPNSPDGQLIESHIREGKIVPVAITLKLIWTAMRKAGKSHFLVDGFPRNFDNLTGWTEVIGDRARVVGMLNLDAAEDVVEARLLERGKTSGRSDDNLASIKKRFATFRSETAPVLAEFEASGKCWRVDAARPRADVYADVRALVLDRFLPQRKRVVFVLGGPGAGKGTQCAAIERDDAFDAAHLSAGDLLRAERADPASKDGQLIETYIKEGKIVPAEITVRLLLRAMAKSGARNVLVDGFPRNEDNLAAWEASREAAAQCDVGGCLFFDVPEGVMERRLLARGEAAGAQRRSDDNIESIRKRFAVFRGETMPIVRAFEQRGKLRTVSADRPVEDVAKDVRRVLGELFWAVEGGKAKSPQAKRVPAAAASPSFPLMGLAVALAVVSVGLGVWWSSSARGKAGREQQ